MLKKSVVIATPDALQRNRLSLLVDRLPTFEVIARTQDLMNTYNEVEERLPKAVLIADVLARLPEFEVMRALFSTLDVRWLVVTSIRGTDQNGNRAYGMATIGSDLFSIPADAPEEVFVQQLCALTRTPRNTVPDAKSNTSAQFRSESAVSSREVRHRQHSTPPASMSLAPRGRADHVILIGASTGGVDALLKVLSRFPENCPPTLVVQHTGHGFGESLAGLLNRQSLPLVRLADGETELRPGQIIIGAGIKGHLVLEKGAPLRATTRQDTPVSGHIPSVDMLFQSAVNVAPSISAAILTGMGRDGAQGMKALRDAGALTIAQDEASCVVYGMPRAAVENNAACKVLPLDQIGDALLAVHHRTRPIGREMWK
jgi:two-component system chemotaxis response regulator CheB